MVSRNVIEQQLHRIGFNPFAWGRTEVRELCNIMMDDEEIVECVNGEYNNGFALIAATNHRVLLVDKKPFLYLTVEDVRFEQISDFNFRNRMLSASVTISSSSKTLQFMSYNKKRLRRLVTCVQRRVVDLRERSRYVQPVGMSQPLQPLQQPLIAQPAVQAQVEPPAAPALSASLVNVPPADPPVIRQDHPHLNRIAVYTRAKLPSLHKPAYADEGTLDKQPGLAEGDVFQQGYQPGSLPDYQAPL